MRRLYDQRELTFPEIARKFGVGPAMAYRYLNAA